MLDDETLMPICHAWARRFLHQAYHLGDAATAFNELTNAAYIVGKMQKDAPTASNWIMWELIRYTKIPLPIDKRVMEGFRSKEIPPDVLAEKKEMLKKLKQARRKLGLMPRIIIERYWIKEKTFEQISVELGLSKTFVRDLYGRAMERMREFMLSEGE